MSNSVKIFRHLPLNGRLEVLEFESYKEMSDFERNFKSVQDTYIGTNTFGSIRDEVSKKVVEGTSYEIILNLTKCRLEEVMTNWTLVSTVSNECPLERLKRGDTQDE